MFPIGSSVGRSLVRHGLRHGPDRDEGYDPDRDGCDVGIRLYDGGGPSPHGAVCLTTDSGPEVWST